MDPNFYLQSGEQTKITEKIRGIAADFNTHGIDLILEILNWLHKNIKLKADSEYKNELFRKRTAEEIIESGLATGCTDYALVFVTLTRAKEIPTKYIEAISTQWLEKGDLEHLEGHVFAEVFINNRWYIVDPQGAVIKAWYGKRYQILGEGLDSWGMGVKNLEDLKNKFLDFKEEVAK